MNNQEFSEFTVQLYGLIASICKAHNLKPSDLDRVLHSILGHHSITMELMHRQKTGTKPYE